MLLDLPRMEAAVSALAEFHALSNAFQQSVPDTRCLHPEFSAESLMWFQNDMLGFLEEVFEAAVTFLESIPGEEQIARRFRSHMSSPQSLFDSLKSSSALSPVDGVPSTPFRCLQHGDSWHNNFVFHKARDVVKVAIVDWQVSYYGSGPSDLCYLLYSSTTSGFRRAHKDPCANSTTTLSSERRIRSWIRTAAALGHRPSTKTSTGR